NRMSSTTEDLILFMMFDEVENGIIPDTSNTACDGTIQGSPRLVPDDMFGSCLSFEQDGDYVSLSKMTVDLANGLTVEAWALCSSFESDSRIIDLRSESGEDRIALGCGALSSDKQKGNLLLDAASSGTTSTTRAEGVLAAGKWTHLAATVSETGSATLYVDGKVAQPVSTLT